MTNLLKPLDGLKILVTDDTADILILFTILLNSAGAKVDVASSGHEAVDRAMASGYDIVLMDLRMPGMTGHEATMKLRNNGYSNPVIAITAHLDEREINECRNSGFSDCIEKSVTRESLVSKILGLLAS
ncbi:MAG: response regulator [Pseudomonadota bacterium]